MKECFDTDTIVTIGNALNWEVAEGMRHLQTCDECRARTIALQTAHSALTETEEVDETVYNRIEELLLAEARSERARVRSARRRVNVIETAMAGITALVVLISAGITPGSATAWVISFASGAILLTAGKMLSRGVSPEREYG
jgi:predicted anti-sigma-YlaC factor YlaD